MSEITEFSNQGAPEPEQKRQGIAARLGGQTLYMAAGNFFTLLVSFPLQIYVSRVLGAGGLGTYGLLEAGFGFFSPLLGLGVPQTALRFLPAHIERKEYASARRLVRLGALIMVAISAVTFLVSIAIIPFVLQQWPEIAAYETAVYLMAAFVPLAIILFFVQQALRGLHEIRFMVLGSSVLQPSIKAVVTIAVFALGYRVEGYVFATLVAMATVVIFLALHLKRRLAMLPKEASVAPDTSAAEVLEWRRYASVSYLQNLVSIFTAWGQFERILLGIFVGPAAVGIFLVVRQLQSLPMTFNNMLLTVGAPLASAAHAREDTAERQHIYTLMTDWVVRASLPLAVFLLIFNSPLLNLYGAEFAADGVVALRILVIATIVNVLTGPCGNIVLMCGLERPFVKVQSLAALLQIVSLVVMVPLLGINGAAISVAAVYVFTVGAAIYLIKTRLGMHWWDARFFRWLPPLLCTAIGGGALRYSGFGAGAVALAIDLVAMYAIFAAVNLLQGLHEDDRELLQHLRKRLGAVPT